MPNAAGQTTLLDIAKHNGSDAVVGLIDETTRAVPEVALGAARTIKGQSYKIWVRTQLPTATFRQANQGAVAAKSTFVNRVVECFILNPRFQVDKAVADRSEDGAAMYIAVEGGGIMEAAVQNLGRCFFYGRNIFTVATSTGGQSGQIPNTLASGNANYGGDVNGFPGLIDLFDATNYEYNANGTTANTASSVWAVKFGPQNVQWVYGEGGLLQLSELYIRDLYDVNSLPYTGYVQEVLAYPGLQLGNLRGVGRIKNLTADAGCTLTDAMIFNLLALFPAGLMPDYLFMSRRSLTQLRNSRTAVNPTGREAPIPDEVAGIQIQLTDSIANCEAISSAAGTL